ncbi:MAG: DUF4831 family protein [Bacteroidales bacterium]|nr:DUF4831 family protein [Bacteroidales bacterium]
MKNINIFIILSLVVFFSCKPSSETRVTKIKDSGPIPESGIIYALPRTNLKFTVEAKKMNVIPGPYNEYAEKYLGIENAPKQETSIWQITDISISTFNDIDPDQYYILEPSGKMNIDFKKLVQNGNVLPVNKSIENNFLNEFYGKNSTDKEIKFTDLSVSKYIGEEQVTYYKRVQRDSLFAKVPVVETRTVHKSFEDKAEEAANFIFMIREKRVELITGMADFYPEGNSLEVALLELNRLENNYLTLFIGKKYESWATVSFEFTPSKAELNQPYILFRFNEESGVLSQNNLSGRPIIIELEKTDQTKNLNYLISDQINREGLEYKDKLYYRIPELTHVRIFDGNTLLGTHKVNIEQYGIVVSFPVMFLMEDERFIEFYRKEEQ